jgi:phosphoadenosine phosphosulfate reductase
LLRKAEKLALLYDKENGFWTGFSGGKDSQALYHVTQLAGVKFKGYFSPTSVDPPEVIRFIRRNYPEVEFTPIKESIFQSFAENHKCLPSRTIRWCCAEFKEKGGEGKVVLVGVRNEESLKRSKRKEIEVSGRKYSGDLTGFQEWSDKRREKLAKDKNFDQFSEHKEQMVTCINGHDKIIVSPIIHWTQEDVWEFLNDVMEVPHCELYDIGWHRIGCICCPMASYKNTLRDIQRYPHVKENWIKAIMRVRAAGKGEITPPKSGISTSRTNDGGRRGHSIYERRNTAPEGREQAPTNGTVERKFLEGANNNCAVVGAESESTEREIAENIFDWWISKKSYKQWYAEKFLQQKLFFT